MKIALVISCKMRFGGAERRLVRVLNEAGKRHEVFFLVRGCSRAFLDESLSLANCDVSHISRIIAVEDGSRIRGSLKTLRRLRGLDVDVVHVYGASRFNAALTAWAHAVGKRVLFSMVDCVTFYDSMGFIEEKTPTSLLSGRLLDFILRRVDVLDVLCPEQLSFYSQKVRRGCLVGSTPGTFTDLEAYRPQPKERLFVFIAARLNKQKNPQLMVDAVKMCQDALRASGYKVLICGCGWEEERIRGQIEDLRLDDIVTMPGYVSPREVLPKAEVLCALQKGTNYPSQTIAEAAASGCFVIATDVGETRRMLDLSFSSLVDPSAAELSRAMESYILLAEDQKRRCFADARGYAERHFSIAPSREYFLGLYESCRPGAR